MINQRRTFLKQATLLTLSLSSQPSNAEILDKALNTQAKPKTVDIIDSDKIEIKIAKIAENNNPVPITVSSQLKNIQSISIVIEQKPKPLITTFRLSPELETVVSTRLNLTENTEIIALVETFDAVYRAKTQVKVIIGGCGT